MRCTTIEPIPGSVRSMLSDEIQALIYKLNINFVEPLYVLRRTGYTMGSLCGGIWDCRFDIISVRTDVLERDSQRQNYYFLHELIHWTGHPRRLCRNAVVYAIEYGSMRDKEMHDTEEATAELGMCKLAILLGFSKERATYYLTEYLSHHPYANLEKAEKDAEEAVLYILGRLHSYK